MKIKKKRLFQAGLGISILAIGALVLAVLVASKPEITRKRPPAPVPPVRTLRVETGPERMFVTGEGTVKPLDEIKLVPQVSGKVVFLSPSLVNGGEFNKGDLLLRIDPSDYRLAVTLSRAKVESAESNLKLAEQEAKAAREEWWSLQKGRKEERQGPPPLVAKVPQLEAAQANLEAAKADLKKALLNLKRTELKAPFDCRVTEKNVGLGQYVAPGQVLASLYSTEAAEIAIPLEKKDLQWFHVPGLSAGKGPGARAEVKAHVAGKERTWQARVVRSEGRMDERTRMIKVMVLVKEPFSERPPLLPGLFVSVKIIGRILADASVVPDSALHDSNLVWVLDQKGRIHYREVRVARRSGNQVIISSGLNQGDVVVVSPLKAVTEGMKVRAVPQKEGSGS